MPYSTTTHLPAGKILTVTADAHSSGNVRRLADPGSATTYVFDSVDVSDSVVLGPFTAERQYVIVSDAGQLTYAFTQSDEATHIIPAGDSLTADETEYSGTHSYQPIGPDLNLGAAAGSTADNPKFLAPIMGNVIGDTLTKEGAYLAGVIGAFSVIGTKATHWPSAGVLGVVMDGVTNVDGAVVAHLDGDSAQTIANAAFKAMMKNTTPGSGFNYGVDLYEATQDGFPALVILKALERSPNQVCRLEGSGEPTTAGTGFAGKGSQYTDYTNANLYINAGSSGTPSWKLVTRAA